MTTFNGEPLTCHVAVLQFLIALHMTGGALFAAIHAMPECPGFPVVTGAVTVAPAA